MAVKRIVARLDDILGQIANAKIIIERMGQPDRQDHILMNLALERALEIISEASRHIPDTIKVRYPIVPWHEIRAFGNFLRHDYQRIDSAVVWKTAAKDMEPLRQAIEAIKSEQQQAESKMTRPTRIETRFAELAAKKRAALITFITAGDPDLATARDILLALPAAGADIIELGMPFSDPMADGPAIQASSLRALRAGHKMADTLTLVRDFRKADTTTPIVLMGYYNPIFVYPAEKFVADAAAAGVDGLIIVDIPPEADDELCLPAIRHGLNFIRLATPTTDDKRLPAVLANTSGFVYYVSITGITGTAAPDVSAVHKQVARIKRQTKLPVAVGFGVKTPEQAKAIAAGADAVVVGSALVSAIAASLGNDQKPSRKTVTSVVKVVQGLSQALTKD